MKFFATFLFGVLMLYSLENSGAAEITLQESIRSAYENNAELKAQNFSEEVAKSRKQSLTGGFLPKVSADVNSGKQSNKIGDNQRINGSYDSKSLNVSQDLFNGGSTIFDINRADSEVKKSQAQTDSKEQEIFLDVINAYLNILRYEELLKVEQENFDSQAKLFEYTKKKIAARDATKSELAKANADYIAAGNSKITTENDLMSSRIIFARLTSLAVNEIGKLQPIEEVSLEKNLRDLDMRALIEVALQNNPELRASRHGVDSARHQSYIAKANLSPSAKFNYSVSDSKNAIYLQNRSQHNEAVYVSFHIPIFNSGVEYAQIGESNNVLKHEKYTLDAMRRKVRQQVVEYVNKIKNLRAKYQSTKEQEIANEVYVATLKEEERLGTKSIIDLLRAKQELYLTTVNRVNLYYDKILTTFELRNLLGELVYETMMSGEVVKGEK